MMSLKTISRAVLCDRAPFARMVPVPDGDEDALDGVGRAYMVPMLGREVEEGPERLAVLDETFDGLGIFGAVLLLEDRDGELGARPIRRISDLAQIVRCSPILTPLVVRDGERPTGWNWSGLRNPLGRVGQAPRL